MPTVVCAVDELDGEEAVKAAIDFCLENEAELRLLGIVKDKFTDSTRGTGGERVRRRKAVAAALDRAGDAARAAGVPYTKTFRIGKSVEDLVLAEAHAVASGEIFFVRKRGRLGAALTRAPRREPAHISLDMSAVRELAAAA